MLEFEVVRWHCHPKKAHKAKAKHKQHGCAPAKRKAAARVAAPVRKPVAVVTRAAPPAAAPAPAYSGGGGRMVR